MYVILAAILLSKCLGLKDSSLKASVNHLARGVQTIKIIDNDDDDCLWLSISFRNFEIADIAA